MSSHIPNFIDRQYDHITSWPFEEARKLLTVAEKKPMVTFETGYGPSGLPHMGTFGEVVRTSMVRHAFTCLTHIPSQLYCFSDDMDGLRKIPDNIPNGKSLEPFLNRPLTSVPDPFGKFDSFAAHNNHRLEEFLRSLNIDYKFFSSTACYQAGMFDAALLKVLEKHREILEIMLPTLRQERQKTYSPFLPISPTSGRVLQVPIEEYRQETIVFRDEDQRLVEVPVTGGHCKLQWKADWGMRWMALGVDYEMAGKDLIDSVHLANKICTVLGGTPPQGMIAEHFIDELGRKISKSKGNGLSVEEWQAYAPTESLAYVMYNTPRRAKKLFFENIPRCVDEYLDHLRAYSAQDFSEKVRNPVWSIHNGHPPAHDIPALSYTLLLNVAGACQGSTKELLWKFVQRLYPQLSPENSPMLDGLIAHGVRYYKDRMEPRRCFRPPTTEERPAFLAFLKELEGYKDSASEHQSGEEYAKALQSIAYTVGNHYFNGRLKEWFEAFYQVLLGQESGPRVGSFVALYGLDETCALIHQRLCPRE